MNRFAHKIALGLACAGMLLAEKSGEPSTISRTVTYHKTDIVPIATEIRFTTLIELPKEGAPILVVVSVSTDTRQTNTSA